VSYVLGWGGRGRLDEKMSTRGERTFLLGAGIG
jgi:hypothetical protein